MSFSFELCLFRSFFTQGCLRCFVSLRELDSGPMDIKFDVSRCCLLRFRLVGAPVSSCLFWICPRIFVRVVPLWTGVFGVVCVWVGASVGVFIMCSTGFI